MKKRRPREIAPQRPVRRKGLKRPPSQLDLEESGIEDFVFGDGSELDWDDPNVGYRRNMLNDHS